MKHRQMQNRRKILYCLAALMLTASLLAACSGPKDPEEGKETDMTMTAQGYQKSEEASLFVDILMDSGQHMVIELDPASAPLTVANFQKLVDQGFYDGLIFHRIIPGFMIQGGDPTGTGRGGSEEHIKGEFASNGVHNTLSHKRGVVSMARTPVPDSASSQFFICHGDSAFLDGDYAAFGRLVLGADELDRIAGLATGLGDYPLAPPVMEKVFFVLPEA